MRLWARRPLHFCPGRRRGTCEKAQVLEDSRRKHTCVTGWPQHIVHLTGFGRIFDAPGSGADSTGSAAWCWIGSLHAGASLTSTGGRVMPGFHAFQRAVHASLQEGRRAGRRPGRMAVGASSLSSRRGNPLVGAIAPGGVENVPRGDFGQTAPRRATIHRPVTARRWRRIHR